MKLTIIFSLFLLSFSASADSIKITNAWIKNLPPVIPVRAGYMTIENSSTEAVTIVGAESEVFTQIDIHETVEKNGMMSMQPLSPLVIPAGSTVRLAPGGIHMMMMHPTETLVSGNSISVTLQFGDGYTQTVQMTIRQ